MIFFYFLLGFEDFDSIRKEMYWDFDVIFICFDIGYFLLLISVVEKVFSVFFNYKFVMVKYVILFFSIYFFFILIVGF